MLYLKPFLERNFLKIRFRLLSIGYITLPSSEDAEDLVQETMIRLLQRDISFETEGQAYSYIIKTFNNLRADHFKMRYAKKRIPASSYISLESSKFRNHPGNTKDILEGLVEAERLWMVSETFKSLSEKCRRIFELLFEKDIDRQKAPAILGISRDSFENRLFFCRKRLKERLKVEKKNP